MTRIHLDASWRRSPIVATLAARRIPYYTTTQSYINQAGEVGVAKLSLTPEVLALIAERFKVLAEPARLQILSCLRKRELTVSEIIAATELGQANVSKHLQLLYAQGFVSRRKEGLYVYYALADQRVFQLCEIMCDRLGAEMASRRRLLAS